MRKIPGFFEIDKDGKVQGLIPNMDLTYNDDSNPG
jgi:hypothetical protein